MNIFNRTLLVCLILIIVRSAIELEVNPETGNNVCTVLMNSFDPINVELKFPPLKEKRGDQNFGIRLIKLTTFNEEFYLEVSDNYTYRKTYQLEPNIPYELCIRLNSERSRKNQPYYVGFTATEGFQSLIGQVEVPVELASQQNLKRMYRVASKLKDVASMVNGHQHKERKLQDEIVTRNIHKEKRIIFLGIIECIIILLSGVYQIFALRKFLIEKNLY